MLDTGVMINIPEIGFVHRLWETNHISSRANFIQKVSLNPFVELFSFVISVFIV